MRSSVIRSLIGIYFILCVGSVTALLSQSAQQPASTAAAPAEKPKPRIRPNDAAAPIPTSFEMLRGAYGPCRANNDLLCYHPDVRVEPAQKFISGRNTIRLKMLKDDTRIQLDSRGWLQIDRSTVLRHGTSELCHIRNLFQNGYLGRDWTGVGISPRFDFIIIHESAHEWFGNNITAADPSDMWIHEGWATYLESLYVEYRWGKANAIKYLSGYKPKIH